MTRREHRIARRTLLGGAAAVAGAAFIPAGTRSAGARSPRSVPRPSAVTPPSYGPLSFYLLGTPVRVYDSRPTEAPGTGSDTAFSKAEVRTIDVSFVLGDSELPTGVDTTSDGVLMNLTVVNTVGAGFVRVWAADAPTEPGISAVNWTGPGSVVANGVITMHGGGLIKAKVDGAPGCGAHLIVDVIGFLAVP